MRVGAIATILSQSSSQVSGSHEICPDQKKFTQVSMLNSFFDVNGIVHRVFVSPEQTTHLQFHLNVLKHSHESLQ